MWLPHGSGVPGVRRAPDKDHLSYPTLQPLLLPTSQLPSGEEEGEETERGGRKNKKRKAVRDGGKTLNLQKTVAHLCFFPALSRTGVAQAAVHCGAGGAQDAFSYILKKIYIYFCMVFFCLFCSSFLPISSHPFMPFYALYSILKNRGAGDPSR